MSTSIRDRIKELCQRRGVSLNQAEKDCGLGKGYISKTDKSKPNSDKLQILAEYLGTNVDYILNGEEYDYSDSYTALVKELRADIRLKDAAIKLNNLSDKNKTYVIELINILSEGKNEV